MRTHTAIDRSAMTGARQPSGVLPRAMSTFKRIKAEIPEPTAIQHASAATRTGSNAGRCKDRSAPISAPVEACMRTRRCIHGNSAVPARVPYQPENALVDRAEMNAGLQVQQHGPLDDRGRRRDLGEHVFARLAAKGLAFSRHVEPAHGSRQSHHASALGAARFLHDACPAQVSKPAWGRSKQRWQIKPSCALSNRLRP